jgi:hypothetical protein
LKDIRQKALFSVLSAISKLTQAALVDAVDLLADGAGCEARVVCGDGHGAIRVAAHGGEKRRVEDAGRVVDGIGWAGVVQRRV